MADNTNGAPQVQCPMNTLTIPLDFKIREVDGITVAVKGQENAPQIPIAPGPVIPPLPVNPVTQGSLGVLSKLVGKFVGKGMNSIFRPNSTGGTGNVNDNILEFNLTTETDQFLPDIGDVPNRGFNGQPDVLIKSVPYQQSISDNLNPDTGKPDLPKPVPIHFENGLFARTPHTSNPNVPNGTISRMASIPHGTTINAQGNEPSETPTPGAPQIGAHDLRPFPIGQLQSETALDIFPQTNFAPTQLRIPQDLSLFQESGFLTEEIFKNPNEVLTLANSNSSKKSIKEHFEFTLATKGTPALPGGGTANIAFLVGEQDPTNAKANAVATSMTVTYWISTVEYEVIIPAGEYDKKPEKKQLKTETARVDKQDAPRFLVELRKKVSRDTTVKLSATQIQYSQFVALDFGGLTWPHISVATLLPAALVAVPADSPALAGLV